MLELWRWPVKSMAGEEVRSFRLDERGVGGDRTHAVIHHHKGEWKPLTAREAPRLLAWHAAYPFAPDAGLRPDDPPHAQVTGPDGRSWRWGDPRLRNALAEDLGRDVRLRRDLAGIQDLERSVLVTTEATRAALAERAGHAARPAPLPHQRPPRAGRRALGRARLGGRDAAARRRRRAAAAAPLRALRDPHPRPGHDGQVARAAAPPRRPPRDAVRHQRARGPQRPHRGRARPPTTEPPASRR